MQQIRTKAIVVHRINYGEADRILHLLTPDHGIVSVIAKGARREKSKLAGGIELFTVTDVTILQGKSDIATLTGARMSTYFMHILDDYAKLQLGYETIKQVRRAAEMVPEPAFFTLLAESFESLNEPVIPANAVEIWFWLQLAILLGVGLNLTTDNRGQKLKIDARYDFDPGTNEFIEHEQGRFSADHIKLLRLLSAQSPRIAVQVKGLELLTEDCLWAVRALRP
jgi:DNA repair protein RecO (recombination protein O)